MLISSNEVKNLFHNTKLILQDAMLTTLEATLEKDGTIRWIEPLPSSRYRILVTLLEKLPDEDRESSLLAEAALAKDWLRPEEEEAWAHLQ